MLGLGLSIPQVAARGSRSLVAAIRSLFAANEPGVWYDPSDLSTLFQDAAGITPVTAVEQPVGLMLDKSGRGNHASQTTTTSRPVLSARVNLLTKTEQFDDAVWTKSGCVVLPNTSDTTNPIGGSNAALFYPTNSAGLLFLQTGNAPNRRISVFVKAAGFSWVALGTDTNDLARAFFNVSTGQLGAVGSLLRNASIEPLANNWYKISVETIETTLGTSPFALWAANGDAPFSVTPDGTSGIYIWGASLVPADQAHLPYQRVNTATDYDTQGFPHYLRFDGVDDWMVTNTITPNTDKAQVFAGARHNATANMLLVGFGAISDAGGLYQYFRGVNAATPQNVTGYGLGGSNEIWENALGLVSPRLIVTSARFDRAQTAALDEIAFNINGILSDKTQNQAASTPVSDSFGNLVLNIGRTSTGALPLNGHLYSLIVRFGPNLPDATIEKTENYVNQKTGAY